MTIPFVGPSYELNTYRADQQSTINMFPVRNEMPGGKGVAYLDSIPGLTVFSAQSESGFLLLQSGGYLLMNSGGRIILD